MHANACRSTAVSDKRRRTFEPALPREIIVERFPLARVETGPADHRVEGPEEPTFLGLPLRVHHLIMQATERRALADGESVDEHERVHDDRGGDEQEEDHASEMGLTRG